MSAPRDTNWRKAPALWWSPTRGLFGDIADTDVTDTIGPLNQLPDDAVRLVPEGRHAARNAIAFGIMAASAWGPSAGDTNLLDDLTDQYMTKAPDAPRIDDYSGGV